MILPSDSIKILEQKKIAESLFCIYLGKVEHEELPN